jgi:ABC-type glycerol-3-phosphate transport system substrate-binding protein
MLFAITAIGVIIAVVENTINYVPKQITLNVVGYTFTQNQMQSIINSFQQQYPNVTVVYNQIDQSPYVNYLTSRFKAGSSGVTPDIYEAQSTDQQVFLKYTHVAPVSVLNATTFKNEFEPLYDRGLLYGGKYVLGVPLDMYPMILLYNKAYLQSVGMNIATITASVNTFNNAISMLGKEKTNVAAVNIGNPQNITNSADILQLFMLENLAQMNKTPQGSADFNNTQGVEALQYYLSFINGDFKANWEVVPGSDTDTAAFAKGVSAMELGYLDNLQQIKQINATLPIGYANYPSLLSSIDLAHYDYFSVYRGATNNTIAWDFLNFLDQKTQLTSLSTDLVPANGYGIISPRTDMPFASSDASLTSVINTDRVASQDWNMPGYTTTEDIFKRILTDGYNGSGAQGLLDFAVQQINTNLQTDISM